MQALFGRFTAPVLSVLLILSLPTGLALAFKIVEDPPACAIALNRQNILYIGIDNPVTIVARGVPVDQLAITTSANLSLKKQKGDDYIVQANAPGEGTITVGGGQLAPVTFHYRVKPIPGPVPLLGARYESGTMGNGVFKAQDGIAMVFWGNFDIDVRCEVLGFDVTYRNKNLDPIVATNVGGRFNPEVRALIDRAKPGDVYFFDNIKWKCPGDGEYIPAALVFRMEK